MKMKKITFFIIAQCTLLCTPINLFAGNCTSSTTVNNDARVHPSQSVQAINDSPIEPIDENDGETRVYLQRDRIVEITVALNGTVRVNFHEITNRNATVNLYEDLTIE